MMDNKPFKGYNVDIQRIKTLQNVAVFKSVKNIVSSHYLKKRPLERGKIKRRAHEIAH